MELENVGMIIDHQHQLQCQALLAMRYAQDQFNVWVKVSGYGGAGDNCQYIDRPDRVIRDRFDDDSIRLSYTLTEDDPLPNGMEVGYIIYGTLVRVGGQLLPMFKGTGALWGHKVVGS